MEQNRKRWYSINDRCHKPHHKDYPNYGGRGITNYWQHDREGFVAYLEEHLGECPEGYTLDRINNNRGYEPGNLRWADNATQKNNQRRSGRSYDRKDGGNSSSGYKWVAAYRGRWRGQIRAFGRTIQFDPHDNPADAYLQVLAFRSLIRQ